jgi:predicted small metal-binding protein
MSNDSEPGELLVKCECGFEARGKETELVPAVQQHGREVHNMDTTPEQVLAMARQPDTGPATSLGD